MHIQSTNIWQGSQEYSLNGEKTVSSRNGAWKIEYSGVKTPILHHSQKWAQNGLKT